MELDKETTESFKRFDVVSDHSDHYYAASQTKPKKTGAGAGVGVGDGDGLVESGAGSNGVQKKIMQEWRILEKHLPDSIYVRAYEKRIDLLRAVIAGAAGTPYHDGLFFFDLAFPYDYPTRPPMVQYRSHGLRLNPNLYANGRVCLSLLNTWTGKKTERWNPAESTVLQVLVSIQALVLNEKPYFNEPGSGIFGHARWEKNSQAYNEDAFVLTCKTTLFSLRNPPKNFEPFVVSHFRQRGSAVLAACAAYATGRVRVGYYADDGNGNYDDDNVSSSSTGVVDVSRRFKGSMKVLYPDLVVAFRRCGASLGHLVEQLKLEKETASFGDKTERTNSKSGSEIGKKLVGTIKRILRLKKKKKNNEDVQSHISVPAK